METPPGNLVAVLLTLGRSVALGLDAGLDIVDVHNPLLLGEWRDPACADGDLPSNLQAALCQLLQQVRARELAEQVAAASTGVGSAGLYLGVATLRTPRGGAPERHVALSLHPDEDGRRLLILRDITAQTDAQHTLAETQSALDAAMSALRAPPRALRAFLGSALTSISAIRSTLRMPARDRDALNDKLARLHSAVAQLATEAEALHLLPVQDACLTLLNRLTALLEREELTGDALLPLATLVDRIASTTGTVWRIEEQRHVEVDARTAGAGAPRQLAWSYASERRWSSFLRHRGEELGVLVAFEMEGAAHVPKHLRAGVDELLQHMLRNAVEHGIETPEERLAANKPALAKVRAHFEAQGNNQLRMTVRDDGRGRGLGLTFLRRAVSRLGGQIAVAAKPEQYTQFVIDLPMQVQGEDPLAVAAP